MITITSTAFDHDHAIPRQYTGEGDDHSPQLSWDNVPEAAEELALICDDPDAPTDEPFVHWLAYGIPADTEGFAENDHAPATEGENDFGNIGYGGPMPPEGHGTHHYHFKLYALDKPLNLSQGATRDELLDAMRGNILDHGQLTGTYERN